MSEEGKFDKKAFGKVFTKTIKKIIKEYGAELELEMLHPTLIQYISEKVGNRALTIDEMDYISRKLQIDKYHPDAIAEKKRLKEKRKNKRKVKQTLLEEKKRETDAKKRVPKKNEVATTESVNTLDPNFAKKVLPILTAKPEYVEQVPLFPNQRALVNYMVWHNRQGNEVMQSQGILVKHGLGSGKTLTALSIADAVQTDSIADNAQTERHVIILLPASLKQSPWVREVIRRKHKGIVATDGNAALNELENVHHYYFIHYNAYNVLRKRLKELNKKLSEWRGYEVSNPFDNAIVIVDEVQNLTNTIRRQWMNTTTAVKAVYDFMVSASNAKMVLLSGTPVVNDVAELCYQINILRGYPIFKLASEDEYRRLQKTFFCKYGEATVLLNSDIFKNATSGIISYYKGNVDSVPDKKKAKKVYISMSKVQYAAYSKLMDLQDALKKRTDQSFASQIATLKRVAAFNVRGNLRNEFAINATQVNENALDDDPYMRIMRMVCNVAWSKDTLKKCLPLSKEGSMIMPSNMSEDDPKLKGAYEFQKPKYFSPKTYQILKYSLNVKSPIVIYCENKNLHGLAYIAGVLKQKYGMLEYTGKEKIESDNSDEKKSDKRKQLRFIRWTGDTDTEVRSKMIDVFNSTENNHGEIIKYVLITKAGREGIEFHNCRQIHIMAPDFNISSINQVVGRVVRINSHASLPKEERVVQPYLYLSTMKAAGTDSKETNMSDMSMDEIIHGIWATEKQKRIKPVNDIMHRNAIDCFLHSDTNEVKCYDQKETIANSNYELAQVVDVAVMNSKEGNFRTVTRDGIKYLVRENYVYDYATVTEITDNGVNRIGRIIGEEVILDETNNKK